MGDYVRQLDERERKEQIRDWAVFGTLARLGATPAETAAATYEMPAARLPYLDELYAFEYGRGRRAYLGKRVLLFHDSDDPDPQATLGRLADRVRMENGKLPASVEVYVIADERDSGTIKVDRAADVSSSDLFSASYGYFEASVTDAASLTAWLGQADDLTYAKLDANAVVLGGRRFAKTRTVNITTEDVAALYQAHEELERPLKAARAKLALLPKATRDAIEKLARMENIDRDNPSPELVRLLQPLRALSTTEFSDAMSAFQALRKETESPGFSLDPQWMPSPSDSTRPEILDRLGRFANAPCDHIAEIVKATDALDKVERDPSRRTPSGFFGRQLRDFYNAAVEGKNLALVCPQFKSLRRDLDAIIATVSAAKQPTDWDAALSLYYQTLNKWTTQAKTDPAAAVGALVLNYDENAARAQCARYIGTKGTRVGMTLFYTDLLAKYWSTDYGLSAPTIEVPGFLPIPRVSLPSAFSNGKPNTRVWFGPRPNSVSRITEGNAHAFAFEHGFDRVYAAGSDPTRPGIESQPNEQSRRTLGWWDRHFDDVATYEPEYQRQNQIMKWALVASALAEASKLRYLQTYSVQRDLNFVAWHKANASALRYRDAITPSRSLNGDECLPLISSYDFVSAGKTHSIAGGVSTVRGNAARVIPPLDMSKALGVRKAHIHDLGAGTRGTATRARPILEMGNKVAFKNHALAVTNAADRPVFLGVPSAKYDGNASRVSVSVGSGATATGELRTQVTGDRVTMTWTDGTVERTRNGRTAPGATTVAAGDALAGKHDIVGATRVYDELPAQPASPEQATREAVRAAAHRRGTELLRKIDEIKRSGATLSPAAEALLAEGLAAQGSSAAAKYVTKQLHDGKPLTTADTSLKVERGQVIVSRGVTSLPTSADVPPAEMSDRVVYIDDRLRVGQEGLTPDTGGYVARWRRIPNVKVEQLDDAKLDILPDQIVETSTGLSVHRVEPISSSGKSTGRPLVIRQCDSDKRTATTQDDC